MSFDKGVSISCSESILQTNKVLRNTYWLLGLTLLFSAAVAWFTMAAHIRGPGFILTLVGVYGLMFLTQALRNSVWGIVSVFAFTGFLGYTLGPLLNMVLHTFVNGSELIATSFGATGVIFLALSAYVLNTKKDFSYLGGFLFAMGIVAMLAMIAGMFFHIPMLHLMISGLFALFASGCILYQTSIIIQGGEQNYIMATIGLFVALYNLFVSLLQLFAAFGGQRD